MYEEGINILNTIKLLGNKNNSKSVFVEPFDDKKRFIHFADNGRGDENNAFSLPKFTWMEWFEHILKTKVIRNGIVSYANINKSLMYDIDITTLSRGITNVVITLQSIEYIDDNQAHMSEEHKINFSFV